MTTPTLTRPLCVDVIFPLAPGCSNCVDKLSEKCRIPCYPFKPFANHASVSRRGVSLWTTLHTCLLALLAVSPQRKETIVVAATWNLVFRRRNGEDSRSWIHSRQRKNPRLSWAVSESAMFDCRDLGFIAPTPLRFLSLPPALVVASLPSLCFLSIAWIHAFATVTLHRIHNHVARLGCLT